MKQRTSLYKHEKASENAWIEGIATFPNLTKNFEFRIKISATGCRFLLTDANWKAQTDHNNIDFQAEKSSGFFKITNKPEKGGYISVWDSITMFTVMREKKVVLLKTLKIEPLSIPSF